MFRRNGDAVLAYASDRLGGHDAQDLVAEVFVVAWRRLETVREGQERPWLFGVARRLILQHQRLRGGDVALRARLHAQPAAGEADHPEPEAAQRADVLRALAVLAEGDREVLLLRYWYDFSGGEAARVLGCSTATFAVRLHRARRRFQAAYERQPAETPAASTTSLTAYTRGLQ
ncbi:sigma-70 family RNA polymerase sigma factor [Polymorphospora sp. NPDC051019]|uniref:RNA polymerase sigma factor n=1 Tax=Polymorphospora sp. NPDC051019 TaxID=3155725 RepID=UPI00341A84B6